MAHAIPARLNRPYTAADGRKFGITVGLAFGVFAAIARWRGHPTTFMVLASLAGVLIAGGLVIPKFLGPVERAWMRFALLLSKITTPIFMGIIYYLVLTPTGLLRRAFAGSALVHKASASGFWADRSNAPRSTLTRQF